MKHYIITRFNTGKTLPNDDDWIKYRLELIETYTFKSLQNQSCKNFEWIILINRDRTDEICKGKLNKLGATLLTSEDLYKYTFNNSIQKHIVISSRLDSDDVVHKDFVNIIQDTVSGGGESPPYVIDFPYGSTYKTGKVASLKLNYTTPFLSFVEILNKDLKLCYNKKHPNMCKIYPVVNINTNVPMWMQIIHKSNVSNIHRKQIITNYDITDYGINL
jgi:hypothetical protein